MAYNIIEEQSFILSEDTPITLYHGSNTIVRKPEIRISGFDKDFGYGFYCTNIEKQAKRWVVNKSPQKVINVYECKIVSNLNILQFNSMSEEWLDFVANCRRGIRHNYDIVEGPMADDQIWNYVDSFIKGAISRAAFWELVKFKYPTHQIVFCTTNALKSLTFTHHYCL